MDTVQKINHMFCKSQNSYTVLLINTRFNFFLFYAYNISKTRDEDGFICLAALHGKILTTSLMSSSITIHILFQWKIQNDTDVLAYDSVDFNLNISFVYYLVPVNKIYGSTSQSPHTSQLATMTSCVNPNSYKHKKNFR